MARAAHLLLHCPRLFDGHRLRTDVLLHIKDDRVQSLDEAQGTDIPARALRLPAGSLLAPGLVDIQVNGGGGVLFNDDPGLAAVRAIAGAHARRGTTALLPTLITDTPAAMARAIAAVRAAHAAVPGVLGIHLEGPHLSPARPGVHQSALFTVPGEADVALLASLGVGRTLVTLAPERVPPGTVQALHARGVRVFAGHTAARCEDIQAAIAEGLAGFTHLYNAMPPLAGREPGPVGAALLAPRCWASLVLDGHHVAPASVAVARAARGGAGRFVLVSDAVSAAGTAITDFMLQGRRIHVRDGRCVDEAGTLAGASITLSDAVRIAHARYGFTLEEALACATRHPAEVLGLADDYGVLAPGARADAVCLDAALRPLRVLQGGKWLDGTGDGARALDVREAVQ